MMLLTPEAGGDLTASLMIFAIILAVLLIVFVAFLMANIIERGLGETGVNVVTRILGMLLAALSVQFVIDGIIAVIPS